MVFTYFILHNNIYNAWKVYDFCLVQMSFNLSLKSMHEQHFMKIQRYLTETNLNLDGLCCFNLGLSFLLAYGTKQFV